MKTAPETEMLGEFRLTAVLGRGGSGVVYDATWGPRRVALKVLSPTLGTAKECAQFVAEAQRLQQIGHPSVVKVLAVGQLPDGRPYLAMERLEGETLASEIARGALPLARALALFGELASAVAALHDQGLVHRDLKPENVFVVDGKHVVLLDFGIAKDLAAPASTTTQEGNVRGTPAYMAPERFFGSPAGITTDVYELALVLYAMLAGRLPWDHVADPEARLAPRPLVELAAVPEPLDLEIRRALSTRAQNRPASAVALLAAVRAAASGSATATDPAVTARLRPGGPTPAPEPVRPPSGNAATPDHPTPLAWAPTQEAPASPPRRRWPWGVAVAAAAAAVGTFAWLRTRPEPAAPPPVTVTPPKPPIVASGSDPWSNPSPPDEPTKALPLVESQLTPETYRAEAAAAVGRLPADTRLVFTAQIAELRAQSQTADVLDKLAKYPKIALLEGMLPPCVKALVSDAEWVVFGAASLAASEHGTLVLRGRWQRKDVDACFANTVKIHTAPDGTKLYRIGDFGWLDFIDTHTAYVTVRPDVDPDAIHQVVRHGAGPQPHAREVFAHLPADRSIAFVADGHAEDDWDTLGLPKGSDVFGWLRVDKTGVTLDAAADPHDVSAATAAVAKLRPQIEDLFKASNKDMVGRLEVVRDKTVVHLRGTMTWLMVSMVSAGVSQ